MAQLGVYTPPGKPYPYAASAGVGTDPSGLGDYFLAPNDPGLVPVSGLGKITAISGLGITPGNPRAITAMNLAASISPAVGAVRDLGALLDTRRRGVGLGQEPQPFDSSISSVGIAVGVALILGGLAVRAGAGYLAGRAMAPNYEDVPKYAWGGLLASLFFGSLGLGVEGAIALSKR